MLPGIQGQNGPVFQNDGSTSTWHDPERHQLASIVMDGPREDVIDQQVVTFSQQGALASITDELGFETLVTEYDAFNRPTAMVDARGVRTELEYDYFGRVVGTKTIDPGTGNFVESASQFDRDGNLLTSTLPNGSSVSFEYDLRRQMTKMTNSLGETIDYERDAAGNVTSLKISDVSEALQYQIEYLYTELSRMRVIQHRDGEATSFFRNKNSEVVNQVDPKDYGTDYVLDALGFVKDMNADDQGTSQYKYDSLGNLVEFTDGDGVTTTYRYDPFSNLIERTSTATGTDAFHYDAAANNIKRVDGAGTISEYAYDQANRLISVTFPQSPDDNESYDYDQTSDQDSTLARGLLTSISGPTGRIEFSYDYRFRVVEKVETIQGQRYALGYEYTDLNDIAKISYPGNVGILFDRDSEGQVTHIRAEMPDGAITTIVDQVQHEPFGPINGFTYGNGLNVGLVFDESYRLSNKSHGDLLSWNLSYDPNSNISGITEAGIRTDVHQFEYDGANRLTKAANDDGSEEFDYSLVGDRLVHTQNQSGVESIVEYDYASGTHRLSGTRGAQERQIQSDSRGNITSLTQGDQGYQSDYNVKNRLVRVTTSDSHVSYQYNPLGHRVVKDVQGDAPKHFIFDREHLLFEKHGDQLRSYVYLENYNLIAAIDQTQITNVIDVPVEESASDDEFGISTVWSSLLGNQTIAFTPDPKTAPIESVVVVNTDDGTASPYLSFIVDYPVKRKRIAIKGIFLSKKKYGTPVLQVLGPDGVTVLARHELTNGKIKLERYKDQLILTDSNGNVIYSTAQSLPETVGFGVQYNKPEVTSFTGIQQETQSLSNGELHFVHTDYRNAPALLTNSASEVVWQADYGSFGDTKNIISDLEFNVRLPGQYFDQETGTYYNFHRDYDPSIARYLQGDPIGLQGGINTFLYAMGNPLRYTDPLGLCPCGDPQDAVINGLTDGRDWSKEADRTDINDGFGPETYKCNLFVDTSFEDAGFNLPNIGGGIFSRLLGRYPPGAQNLSDPSYEVPGWPVVSGPAQPGDLVSEAGHVGIYTNDGNTVSASPQGVVENDWGSRPGQKPVFRRCSCN